MSETSFEEDTSAEYQERDRSIDTISDLDWDNYVEVRDFDECSSNIDIENVSAENIDDLLCKATKELQDYQDCSELQRLFPNPQSKVGTAPNKDCDTSDLKRSAWELVATSINHFHDINKVQTNIYEISRQQLVVPESQVMMSQQTYDLILRSNPYTNRQNDTMGERLDLLFAFVWDSAVLSTLNMTNFLDTPQQNT